MIVQRRIIYFFIFTVLFGLLINDFALAQPADNIGTEYLLFEEIPSVFTASKREEKATEAPATVYVISRKDIELRGYVNLKDVLRDVPGMETIEYYFSEQGTLVPVRGVVGNNKIVVLVNGMRINPPGGEELMLRSDLSVRMAEQIEIIYGPGSTLYGQDAISAVINIITKKPGDGKFGEAVVSFGTESYKEQYIGFANRTKYAEFSGFIQMIDSGATRVDKDYPAWWSNYSAVANPIGQGTTAVDRWDEGLNAFFRMENETDFIQIWHRKSSRSSSEGSYAPTLFYVAEAEWEDSSTVVQARNEALVTDDILLESTITYNKYEAQPDTRYVWPSGGAFFYNDFKYAAGTGVSLEEKVLMDVTDKLGLIGGVTVSHYDIIPKCTVPGSVDRDGDVAAQAGSFEYYTQLGVAASKVTVQKAYNLRYQTQGAYLEADYQITDAVKTIIGGRVDTNSRYNEVPFSPRLAAIYDVDENWTLKYIFTKAYVSPPPYFGYNVFDNGTAINITNPNLEPEKAVSNEVNVSYSKEKLSVGLSGYYNKQDKLLIVGDQALPVNTVQNVVYTDLAGTGTRKLTQTVNAGESRSLGFDLFGRYSIGKTSFWGSFSYVDYIAEIGGQKTGLDGISRDNVRLGMTYALRKNLWITPSLVYRSTPANINNALSLDQELKNPHEINMHILYKPKENWSYYADLRNITNHKYAVKGILGALPQETFRADVGVKISY
ncbi:MAG: TonB-dependent receptor [Candidatus Omnitrophota bacterium]